MDYYRKCQNVAQTCRHFDIPRKTFYYWKKRYDPYNLFSLEDKSQAPKKTRQKEITSQEESWIVSLRKQHMVCGKLKLQRLYQNIYLEKISSWKIMYYNKYFLFKKREITTSDPNYYRWTQRIFLKLYQAGLLIDKTVLANEQVIDGKCERCDSLVGKKYLKQWFFKITDYAERLLSDLAKIDWPEKIKVMQRNWIGKSEGTNIKFPISNFQFQIDVFTTRVDTLFCCTYLVIAPEHSIIESLKSKIENGKRLRNILRKPKRRQRLRD